MVGQSQTQWGGSTGAGLGTEAFYPFCPLWPLQVVVFSWSGCPYCKRAKALLDTTGARYTALELDQMPEGKRVGG